MSKTSCARERIPPIACRACDLNTICRLTGLVAYEGGRPRQPTGALRTLRPGAALFRAGAPASALFAIRQGTIKLTRVTAEGDERIVSFHTPGEVLGLEAFSMGAYVCDAIALEPVQCCELPLPLFSDRTAQRAEIAAALVQLLSRAVAIRPDFARGSARERVMNFLLDLSQRYAERGLDASELRLSMSRLEIANLLDTRIETVSRTLQQLNREQVIHVRGNRVRLVNAASELAMAANERSA
ncbi:MAG TPA: cyclic nucleotide-binding domain-containing protein [Steroidobacter sp.]|jgi:CRP/FNR family transcriptional regulator|nr:cyclic nucleotide-binding domain-containing protein [Steroidobacter sp.]